MLFDLARMAGHEQLHIAARQLVPLSAADHDLLKILAVHISDATLDQAAFFVNQSGRGTAHRNFAHIFPKSPQILPVAPDFSQRALRAGGANNQAHAVGHIQLADNGFQLFAVCGIVDFARNATAAGGVGHQHAIASGKRQIGRQRGALIATLFFQHLHKNDLAPFDNFLNFIFAIQRAPV